MKYKELRKKYSKFIFDSYSYKKEAGNFIMDFKFKSGNDIEFNHRIKIPLPSDFKDTDYANFVFNIGMIEMISYWKATCSPVIEIRAGKLNNDQLKFWKDLITNGMGQYFYENKINFKAKDFLKIISYGDKIHEKIDLNLKELPLVGIGGGKDSVVTLELLKDLSPICFAFSTSPSLNVIRESGQKSIILERIIDPKLLELNKKGFLNGHTPFSAFIAFLGIAIAAIYQMKYVVISNERSASEGNTFYLGKEINHQYSKSLDFENKFRKYYKKYISKDIEYFSFLRPWHEIQIAKKFSELKQYHGKFLSCNIGQADKSYKWCGKCPKCLFVFMMLYPFMEKDELVKIFKKNLFEDEELLPIFKGLIGLSKIKPFECVGTRKEAIASMIMSLNKDKNDLPYLLRYFKRSIPKVSLQKAEKMLDDFYPKHNIPDKLIKYLK
ncbi:MAG TPA: hypothetical protein PLA41_01030 [Candidatus Pacearchaeota archaeon]|nr:hypothetical protein [Candidatus Parcubacteria bacterium]HOU45715.1 hypothetical protein [Candidatus Pacearchaeota archaeon]HPM08248.1 hypothetical protein [Candidatus Pacearchaeota archaeon]HQI74432.1 hypothetical protein [Candidatus Pacearchaeota archaeon]